MITDYCNDKFGKYVRIAMNHQPSGGNTWLARITGPDPKYKLKREFLTPTEKNHSSSGKTGTDIWHIRKDGFYEFNEAWKDRGFFKIENGELSHVTRDEVLMTVAQDGPGGQCSA